jgi:eukaryotic-like serine/threonine-protein kinase
VPKDLEAIVMEALSKSPENRYQSADELRADLIRFGEGQPVEAAQRDTAFFGADATRAVAAVPGERTRSVPIMSGPRTDVRRRRRNPTGWIILAIVVILAAAGGAYAYAQNNKSNNVELQSVVGETVLSATRQLGNEGFVVATKGVNSTKTKNTVIAMSPKAGKSLAKGSSVKLTVSLGVRRSPVTVPFLVGMSVVNAENELQHLQLSYVPNYTSNAQPGQIPGVVLSQSPIQGTKTQTGTTVTLLILAPNSKYPLNSVDGLSQVAAGAKLTQQGLLPASTVQRTCSNTVAQGLVVSTNPVAGTLVTANMPVTLIVSSGYCQVVVPSVVNDTVSEASAALSAQGLEPQYTNDPVNICDPFAPQTATTETPSGGSSVTYGSTVALALCQDDSVGGTTTTTTTTSGT